MVTLRKMRRVTNTLKIYKEIFNVLGNVPIFNDNNNIIGADWIFSEGDGDGGLGGGGGGRHGLALLG